MIKLGFKGLIMNLQSRDCFILFDVIK